MSALSSLRFDGDEVRTMIINDEPWFVARDACSVLGISKHRDAIAQLEADERASATVDTLGGPQQMAIVNEAGVYALMLISRSPRAREFQRWLTHEVVPSIRRTGQYVAPVEEAPEHLMARALIQAQGIIERKDVAIAALTPRAEAWDELASAEGDYEVADAAKILARAGVETGRTRLFNQMNAIGWIYRSPQGKWKARQTAVDSGYLREKPQSHHHPRTGELVLDPPQVRVTLRGLERLRVRLGKLHAVEVAS
ncbi:BRO family protein [Microbacterium aurantiacum]|uniref:BRO family protein n=1 Tax=Microbacterium aurantiacum TaxID=162393 RepID=UPI00343F0FF3